MSNYSDTPPNPKALQMRKKHSVDSVKYDATHGMDHLQTTPNHLSGLKQVDPQKATQMASTLQSQLVNLHNQISKVTGGTMTDTTKKTGMTDGKSNTLGGGGRLKQMTNKGVSPALAAYIGRKKYGAKAMASMAAKK